MGERLGNLIKEKQLKIEKDQAIADYFVKICDESKENELKKSIVKMIKKCLNERGPISDDLLLIAWRFDNNESNQSNQSNQSKLSDFLFQTCTDILTKDPINLKEKKWFDKYIANSSVCSFHIYII